MAKREKLSVTLDPEIKKEIIDYSRNHNISISQVVERASRILLNKDSEVLNREVRNTINSAIKTFEDRYCRILAKLAKTTYSNMWLDVNILAYMANNEEDAKFIKELIETSNRKGYETLKDGLIERDIDTLFPKEDINKLFDKR